MSIHLQRDLDRLNRDVVGLAALVEQALRDSIEALHHPNSELSQRIIVGDNQIDSEQNEIEDECLKILALHQPVAGDLRRVTSTLHVVTDLERIGDLAEDIAERALDLEQLPSLTTPKRLHQMAESTLAMVRLALDAFVNRNTNLARIVCRKDDEIDRLGEELMRDLVEFMQANPQYVEVGLSLFSITRHLERIADHATNIAEDVVYLVEGEIVRHTPASREPLIA